MPNEKGKKQNINKKRIYKVEYKIKANLKTKHQKKIKKQLKTKPKRLKQENKWHF